MMKYKKTASAILSAVMFCSALPAFPSVYAAESTLPDWIPTNYKDACAFRNTYGSTRVQDDLICIVTYRWKKDGWSRLPMLGSGNYETLLDEWYCVPEDMMVTDKYFHVTVYKPEEAKTVVFYDYNADTGEESKKEDQYVFSVDADLHVTEADWRAYVPDCKTEYTAFMNSVNSEWGFGRDSWTQCVIDSRSNYLLMAAINDGFCGSIMNVKADLDGEALTLKHVSCNYIFEGPEPTDQPTYFVAFCPVTKEGDVSATFTHDFRNQEEEPFSVTQKLSAVKDADGRIELHAFVEEAEEWREYVPDTSGEAYAFLRSEGLVSSTEMYNEFNIDNRGHYLIAATASYGGLSPAMAMVAFEKDGKSLKTVSVNCKPVVEPGMAVDGECYIQYIDVQEPCLITAFIRNGSKKFDKEVNISVTRDADGVLCFAAEEEGAVPGWVPSNEQTATEFRLNCGSWHAQDGILCLCLPYELSDKVHYVLDDPDTAGDFAKHELLTTRQILLSNDRNVEQGYQVMVFKVTSAGNLGMKWVRMKGDTPEKVEGMFSFAVDEDLKITDSNASQEYDFLPKNFTEAKAFYENIRAVSVHDGYIVCCGETNVSTGYEILTETAGTTDAELVKKASFSYEPNNGATGGNRTYRFFVYKPKQKGQLKITARHAREWEYHDGTVLDTKYYEVADDLSLTEFKFTMGDVTGDGKLTVEDAVALSKYLGGTGRLEGKQFFAADMLNDNRINAADLSVMKRQLMELRNPPPPGDDA